MYVSQDDLLEAASFYVGHVAHSLKSLEVLVEHRAEAQDILMVLAGILGLSSDMLRLVYFGDRRVREDFGLETEPFDQELAELDALREQFGQRLAAFDPDGEEAAKAE